MKFEKFFKEIVDATIEFIELGKVPPLTVLGAENGMLVVATPQDSMGAKLAIELFRKKQVDYIVIVGVARMKIFGKKEDVAEKLKNYSIEELADVIKSDPNLLTAVFIIGVRRDGSTKVKVYEVTITESGKCNFIGELKQFDTSKIGGNLIPKPW